MCNGKNLKMNIYVCVCVYIYIYIHIAIFLKLTQHCKLLYFNNIIYILEKAMAPYSSVLAWRILWTGEPGGLLSMGSHRVGHDWSDLAAAYIYIYIYTHTHKHIYMYVYVSHIFFIHADGPQAASMSWGLRLKLPSHLLHDVGQSFSREEM